MPSPPRKKKIDLNSGMEYTNFKCLCLCEICAKLKDLKKNSLVINTHIP